MTTSSLGITSLTGPLLPITGSFAAPMAAYFVLLSGRVVTHRLRGKQYMGADASPSQSHAQSKNTTGAAVPGENQPLYVAMRAHSNFAENVPIALLLAGFVEANGGSSRALVWSLSALLLARIAHVELGMNVNNTLGKGRPFGHLTTLGVIGFLAGYGAYLVKPFWGL